MWANFQNTFLDIFLSWGNRGIWLGQSHVSFRFLLKMEIVGPCCIWLCIFVLRQFGLASTFNLDFSLNQRRIGSGAGEVQNWRCLFYSLHTRVFSSFTLCTLACFPLLALFLYFFAHSLLRPVYSLQVYHRHRCWPFFAKKGGGEKDP